MILALKSVEDKRLQMRLKTIAGGQGLPKILINLNIR
jgi:hypothetical protein